MGYRIAAAVASLELLTADRSGLPVVPLDDGWALVPFPSADPDPPEDVDPVDVESIVRRLSAAGPVAFVWADIFGGHGTQRGEVWRDGTLIFGPVEEWIGAGPTPISRALAALGVQARGRDEFGTVRLDRHRDTVDWLDDALTPPSTQDTHP